LQEDQQLDAVSVRPGEQRFEKLVSGFYIGKIVPAVVSLVLNFAREIRGHDRTKDVIEHLLRVQPCD
jgi:hexokinase